MKRKVFILLLAVCALPLMVNAQGSFFVALFNVPAQDALDVYLPGGVDDDLSMCTYFQRSWDPVSPTGGWLTNQFKAPDIKTPSPVGPEGGNALYGNSDAGDSTREGYWIELNPAITGSFTMELFFYAVELDPDFAEYKIQNLISSFWMTDSKGFELRYYGATGPYGNAQLEVMTHDGSGEHNIKSATGLLSAGVWYYAAVVYDHAANQIRLYFKAASDVGSPTLIGSNAPGWGTFTMQWICLAAWPNPAGSCRDICGYIDAFALSHAALDPAQFVLLTRLGVDDWMNY